MSVVPQRGVLQAAVRVVDDHDLARDGQGAAHGPVVAADLQQLLLRRGHGLAVRGYQARVRFHELELR